MCECAKEISNEVVLPQGLDAAIMALSDDQCRWPFGDPDEAAFHFCPNKQARDKYCAEHFMAAWVGRLRPRLSTVARGLSALAASRSPPLTAELTIGPELSGLSAVRKTESFNV